MCSPDPVTATQQHGKCRRTQNSIAEPLHGAGWHRPGGRLRVPENITLLRLPPYAPELNPMENVWEYLRGNQLSMIVWRTYTAILDACCHAWNSLMKDAKRIISITTRPWAQVKV